MDLEHSKSKSLQFRAMFTIFQNRNGFRNRFRNGFGAGFREKLNPLENNAFLVFVLIKTTIFYTLTPSQTSQTLFWESFGLFWVVIVSKTSREPFKTL